MTTTTNKFPSPLEVDRFISKDKDGKEFSYSLFPSPLEVDRFISFNLWQAKLGLLVVSVPSRGR